MRRAFRLDGPPGLRWLRWPLGARFGEWAALGGSARMTDLLEGVVRDWGAVRANRSGVRRLGAGARGRPGGRSDIMI